jgi:hypothetical protein
MQTCVDESERSEKLCRVTHKPTTDLIADLRAEREYLKSGPPAFRARASRNRIRELEAALAARGEMVEPEAGPSASTSQRKIYHAEHRVQMTAAGWEGKTVESTLATHEDRGDGTGLCGQGLRDWTDPNTGVRWRMVWSPQGPGPVTCGRCANASGEPTGYEPLAEPQGESVRTVSGGAFETNRRRH